MRLHAAAAAAAAALIAALASGWIGVHQAHCVSVPSAQFVVTVPAVPLITECQRAEGVGQLFGPAPVVDSIRTPHQALEVRKHDFFGSILAIDGTVQVVERDEANYHEMAAHVPMAFLNDVPGVRVLVIGGGDGGAALRFLQHSNVAGVTQVDIDFNAVRQLSERHFATLRPVFQNPRFNGVEADAAAWVDAAAARGERYDVILVDVTDCAGSMDLPPGAVTEESLGACGGASAPIFNAGFFVNVKMLLSDSGVLVRNTDSPSWDRDSVVANLKLLRNVWSDACTVYHLHQPSFLSGHYAFIFCSEAHVSKVRDDVDRESWEAKGIDTEYYSPELQRASFVLPRALQMAVDA
eukprot:TRINITY_DN20614_c0_g1_i2.p1 TRINITY_DN20614_c0_g1~~TRINITY_DN20614_c0_g1_i2.p1  ORF type:complete len:352 (+),score=107.76 TRINITY_DN20614_c0_g1_i2:59-1114(+)